MLLADDQVGFEVTEFFLSKENCPLVGVGIIQGSEKIKNLVRQSQTDIPLIEYTSSGKVAFVSEIRSLKPEIMFLAWWPIILKEELGCGQHVTLNTHPSLLPYGRGKDPNFWALADGEPYGVTIHHVGQGIDDGPIAFQKQIPYNWIDNGKTLYERAQIELLSLLRENYGNIISLNIPQIDQDLSAGSSHKRADLDNKCELNLDSNMAVGDLLNLLRARTFKPYPGCHFIYEGKRYEVRIEVDKID